MFKKIERYNALEDEEFNSPYVDIDELRERQLPDLSMYQYRYVHGGFTGTDVKFSFHFPLEQDYEGRFFQYLSPFPGPDEELGSIPITGVDDRIGFALSHGAYFVETNMGSKQMFGPVSDPSLIYRSSAAAAEYSRQVARDLYGEHRAFGYVYGASGGGFKTMECIEKTTAFDGAVPHVIGSPVALPSSITVRGHALRVLRNKFPQINDNLDVGGSGDMYQDLNDEERAVLEEVTLMGFPPRSWFAYDQIGDGALPVLMPGILGSDPEYVSDFWSKPGYLGSVENGSAQRDRIFMEAKVTRLPQVKVEIQKKKEQIDSRNGADTAWQKQMNYIEDQEGTWIEFDQVPCGDDLYLDGLSLIVQNGKAQGQHLKLDYLDGNRVYLGAAYGVNDAKQAIEALEIGDVILFDNSDYIAVQTYHRHIVPEREYTAWDQFRDEVGQPIYPQREVEVFGDVKNQSGLIAGRTIVIASLMDESALPWQADWYRRRVANVNGNEEDIFRLYYIDNSFHDDVTPTIDDTHLVPYIGAVRQSLLDLSAWVERGVEPLKSSSYEVKGGQIIIGETANDRKGIQPVIRLRVNNKEKVNIKVGETVTFEVSFDIPENAGQITSMEWSFEGEKHLIDKDVETTVNHTYTQEGTYFAAVRVGIERLGNRNASQTQIYNVARVRVVVEA